jgi:hypothetical protein
MRATSLSGGSITKLSSRCFLNFALEPAALKELTNGTPDAWKKARARPRDD